MHQVCLTITVIIIIDEKMCQTDQFLFLKMTVECQNSMKVSVGALHTTFKS